MKIENLTQFRSAMRRNALDSYMMKGFMMEKDFRVEKKKWFKLNEFGMKSKVSQTYQT